MSEQSSGAGSSITLDQLVALNDEIAALARAGVPLEKGLIHVGGDLPGRLGRITTELGQRLEAGEGLAHALAADASLPPAYRAIVAAGMRSGRLAVALEGMSSLIRRTAETRRLVTASLVYPLVVLAVAYGLLVFTTKFCFPGIESTYSDLARQGRPLELVKWFVETLPYWGPWLPILFVVVVPAWWVLSRRAWAVEGGRRGRKKRWFSERYPTVGNLLFAGRMATFAEVLALLVEHEVPLIEAVALSTDASGDRRLRESGRLLSEQLQRGEKSLGVSALTGIPPVLAWLLVGSADRTQMISALRRAADSYRRRARWMTRWLSLYLPIWLTTAIGGTAAVLYAIVVIGPWSQILFELGQPLQ